MYTKKNIFGRSFTTKQVGKDSETEGQGNEAIVIGQGIYELVRELGKEEIPDLSPNDKRYIKEVLRRGRQKWNQKDLLANSICHLLI